MPISFRQVGPCFAAEIDGIDIAKPLTAAEVAAIHGGMDKYARSEERRVGKECRL